MNTRWVADGVEALHKDDVVYIGKALSMERDAVHGITLVTLGESYATHLDGQCIAEGHLDPPYSGNEGRLGVIVKNAGLRIITCEGNFIVHDVDYPQWERGELLHEEEFGQDSFDKDWVTNGEAPTVSDPTATWCGSLIRVRG
ncbi:MAG: hypothetical protein R6V12_18025 [Candidatus Hydrogenedentota bacterium]